MINGLVPMTIYIMTCDGKSFSDCLVHGAACHGSGGVKCYGAIILRIISEKLPKKCHITLNRKIKLVYLAAPTYANKGNSYRSL